MPTSKKKMTGNLLFLCVSGKKFSFCHPWMVSQAQEFIDLIGCMGDVMELEIYGGMLHQILVDGASRADLKEI
jgi:hypothetical protein